MVNLDFKSNGIHIFIKNGKRYINYGAGDINAGKYYYLNVLSTFHLGNSFLRDLLMNSITNLYNLTSGVYSQETFVKATGDNIRKITDFNYRCQMSMFLLVIYLAMIDLEENSHFPKGSGKRMVYESCREVLINGMDYKKAAVMFQKERTDPSISFLNHDWDDYGTSGSNYGWYNDYSDDVIDDAFDGHPEATWNVD